MTHAFLLARPPRVGVSRESSVCPFCGQMASRVVDARISMETGTGTAGLTDEVHTWTAPCEKDEEAARG